MQQHLKNEYRRLFGNKLLYVILGIEIFIVVLQACFEVVPYLGNIYTQVYPLTVFEKWIGGENSSIFPVLYFMIAPLFIAIPYGGTLKEDLKTGYIKNIFTRSEKKKYFIAKYIVSFSTGALAVIPLIINFLIIASMLPATIPQTCTGFHRISSISLLGDLFYTHPYTYVIIWLALDLVFWGLISTISLVISFFTDYVYVSVLAPFLVCLGLYGISMFSQLKSVAPFDFLNPSQPVNADLRVILIEGAVFILAGGCYLYAGCKKELY